MELPINIDLPFFAYGIFKKGQISHFQIKPFIKQIMENHTVDGLLRIRDGIPIIDTGDFDRKVKGDLIWFQPQNSEQAYKNICSLEPKKYYKWELIETQFGSANILVGIKPDLGSVEDVDTWDSWSDSLFTVSFEIIDETLLESEQDDALSGKRFLRLQMAYLLLWSCIERFVALRYNFRGKEVMVNVYKLADETKFKELVLNTKKHHRVLYGSDNVEDKRRFDKTNPLSCIKYYYQLRSNITHRGKAAIQDISLVKDCLIELSDIFKHLLQHAKENS